MTSDIDYFQRLMDLGPDGWRMFLYYGDAPTRLEFLDPSPREDREADMRFVVSTPHVTAGSPSGFFTLTYLSPDWTHVLVTACDLPVVLTYDRDLGTLLEARRPDGGWWRFSTLDLSEGHKDAIRWVLAENPGSLAPR